MEDVDLGWDDEPIAGQRGARAAAKPAAVEIDDGPAKPIDLAPDLPPEPAASDLDPASACVDDEHGDPPLSAVRNMVGVKLTAAGKIYRYDAGDSSYRKGEQVIVESDRGPTLGTVAIASSRGTHGQLKRVLRRPNRTDLRNAERATTRAAEALATARAHAKKLKLPIKLFRAEHGLTGNRVRFYFSANERVDYRTLTRELSRDIKGKVEMRQTGVRDEAKMVGGIGSCGRELCCTTWLPDFVPVSIKMAKDQGLVLNPQKVSGQCGRLKCCLVYEQEMYAALRKGLPKLGKRVVCDAGEGRVVEVDVLHQRVRVSLGPGDFVVLPGSEVRPMFPSQKPNPSGKGKGKGKSKSRGRDRPPTEPASPDGGAPAATAETTATAPAGAPASAAAPSPAPGTVTPPTPPEPAAKGAEAPPKPDAAPAKATAEPTTEPE